MKRAASLFLFLALSAAPSVASVPDPTSIELVKQDGKSFRLADMKGNHWLVSFVFTRCPMPEACPLTMRKNKEVYRAWKKTTGVPPLKFLIVTLDPAFDTPAVLARWMKDQGLDPKAFTLATGKPEAVDKFASQLANVTAFPAGGTLSHNVKTVLLDPDLKEVAQLKDNEWKADDVIKALKNSASRG